MKWMKETILGVMIVELVEATGASISEFLSNYKSLLEKYVDFSVFKTLLEQSEPEENWDIIQRAKKLALGGGEIERNRDIHLLCSVFSNLSVDGEYPAKRYYMPEVLDVENVIPRPEIKEETYANLLQEFNDELEQCMNASPKDFDSFVIVLDTLLKKYFWAVPASGRKDEDISLYEYIRAAAAIAGVLVQDTERTIPYLLVGGHFSGIQKYIFSVSRVGTGGVTKRLRARSFYVNAMVSALAHCIIHKFGLTMVNVLMLTGGKFYLLLPNTAQNVEELQKLEKEVTAFLYSKFKGSLSLELVWEQVTDESLCNYGEAVTRISEKIEGKKGRLLESVLVKGEEWELEKFVVYQDLAHKSMCKACKGALVDEGKEMCPNCETDTEIGGKLPKIKAFSFSRKEGQYKLLDDYYLNLDISAGGEHNYLIMQLNDANIAGRYDEPVVTYYAVNNVPLKGDGTVKTFSEIAEEAQGSKKLGIMKADVDTLGFLISEGLRSVEDEKIPVSRVNTLSCMLDLFFGGCLQRLIESRYQNVYCVFSGGDDLFFIGPWSDMPALAIDINRKFHEYAGDNPCVTLSAAICMAESGGHISTLAEHCEEKLKWVKQKVDPILSSEEKDEKEKKGRNGIYFLGKRMSWEDFQEQTERGRKFAQASTRVGTGILRRLLAYSGMYQDFLKNEETEKLAFLPLFSNDMKRNFGTLKKAPDFQKHCEELYKKASNYRKVEKQFYYVEFCTRYALQLTKEERKNG